MKITKQKAAEISNKMEELSNLKSELKKEFFGIDKIIDNIISSMEPWYLFPDSIFKPWVVNLWGMTGSGKTALVRKIIEFLNFRDRYLYFNMSESQGQSSRYYNFNNKFDEELNYLNKKPCIICLDELQAIRTINENFEELDRSENKKVWELIDTGKFTYYSYNVSDLYNNINNLIKFLNECLRRDIVVENGYVVEGAKKYSQLAEELADKYSLNLNYSNYSRYKFEGKAKKKCPFIPNTYYEDLYGFFENEFSNTFEFENYIQQLDGKQSIHFLHKVSKKILLPRTLDLSKSLIFVIGNLDEAFAMSYDMNPDNNPDLYYEHSLNITVTDIKNELRRRFRQEQIARLGNNHLIYPAFNNETFYKIIRFRLNKVRDLILKKFGLNLVFEKSVEEILFKEGVFPTQGARPLLTTINLLIDTHFTKTMNDIIKLNIEVDELIWKYEDKKFIITLFDSKKEQIKVLTYQLDLKVENSRVAKDNDEQAFVAVHEAGHAIMIALKTHLLPDSIFSVSTDSSINGQCQFNLPDDIMTKNMIRHRIMIALGGYIAEELIFGKDNTSAGVSQDLREATKLAAKAIREFGMGTNQYLVGIKNLQKPDILYHEDAQQEEVKNLINQCEIESKETLEQNKHLLLEMSKYLTSHSKMDKKTIEEYIIKYSTEDWVRTEGFKTKDEYYTFKNMVEEQLMEFSN